MRLIDAEKLVGKEGLFGQRGCPGNCQHCSLWTNEGCLVIIEAPTVDPVKHGEWISDGLGDGERICSVCKRYALYTHRDRYDQYLTTCCPHCGAKMDGGVANETD